MGKVFINDDFDLEKIVKSGQSFRATEIKKNFYRFGSGNKILYIQKVGNFYNTTTINSSWEDFWEDYFDLGLDYKGIRKEITGKNSYLDKAIEYGKGIRILKQDPYETLLSFIIAQRKTIPSITNCINKIMRLYGDPIKTPFETVYSFPDIRKLNDLNFDSLKDLKLGYRTKYFKSAIDFIIENNLDFSNLEELETKELIKYLKNFYGIGDKIANCVALFSYHRLEAVPIDVWIDKSIKENFNSINPFIKFEKYAGIVQQYLFYYERERKLSKQLK